MVDDDLTEYPSRRVRLQQCQFCERQFNVEYPIVATVIECVVVFTLKAFDLIRREISKHQAICRKVSNKKRRVFDAGRQRAANSDVSYKATKKTAQIYNGEIRPEDARTKNGSKSNWRQKHQQLIKSVREARAVTQAMKQGGPLPAFRPSEVPSDYVNCPYCHRNFNEHAAKRHIPFCQTQHGRKQVQPSRPNQQYDRGRTLPPQKSSQYRQEDLYSSSAYSGPHDDYSNGYKHSNSAPMIPRRNVSQYQQPQQKPLPPPRNASGGWNIRKAFGFDSQSERKPSSNYYSSQEDDYYEPPSRRPLQQPVLMRTGRNEENTGLNVRARNRNDAYSPQAHQKSSTRPAPSTYYTDTRYQYGNSQYNSTRPTAIGRLPPSATIRCGECGSIYNNTTAKYCAHCGSRR